MSSENECKQDIYDMSTRPGLRDYSVLCKKHGLIDGGIKSLEEARGVFDMHAMQHGGPKPDYLADDWRERI